MEQEKIYKIGEMFALNEFDDIVNVSYPKEEPPKYFIVELENGTKLKVSILE